MKLSFDNLINLAIIILLVVLTFYVLKPSLDPLTFYEFDGSAPWWRLVTVVSQGLHSNNPWNGKANVADGADGSVLVRLDTLTNTNDGRDLGLKFVLKTSNNIMGIWYITDADLATAFSR